MAEPVEFTPGVVKLSRDQVRVMELQSELLSQWRAFHDTITALLLSNGGQLVVTDKAKELLRGPGSPLKFQQIEDVENRRTVYALVEKEKP